jgi:hypothetical protein
MKAENIFAKAGFKEEEYTSLIEKIVSPDIELTKSLAENICNTMKSYRADIEQKVKDDILNGVKKPSGGSETLSTLDGLRKQYAEASAKNDLPMQVYLTRRIAEEEAKLK